jgi:nitrogen regulatory protein P-II 1
VHRSRVADVITALKASPAWTAACGSENNLTAYMVKGSLVPIDNMERHYSVELGDEVVNEYKLELHCAGEHVDELVAVICSAGRTGQANAEWIYVADIAAAIPIL